MLDRVRYAVDPPRDLLHTYYTTDREDIEMMDETKICIAFLEGRRKRMLADAQCIVNAIEILKRNDP
mgnify:CR=1 FL=1